MKPSELVVAGTFLSRVDADLAKGALTAAGIDALISADDVGGLRPHFAMSGIRLMVRTEDADDAREILNAEP